MRDSLANRFKLTLRGSLSPKSTLIHPTKIPGQNGHLATRRHMSVVCMCNTHCVCQVGGRHYDAKDNAIKGPEAERVVVSPSGVPPSDVPSWWAIGLIQTQVPLPGEYTSGRWGDGQGI